MALHGGLSSVKLSRLLALTVLVLNGSLFRNLTLVGEPGSALFFCALRHISLPLGLAIYFLRKMPRKPDESSVECYGHGFLIAARPRGV